MSNTKTFLDIFDETVHKNLDKTAIVDHDGQRETTYASLNDMSNRFCTALKKQSIGKGDRIIVRMERCAEYIAAELGILKAGASYIALLPEYPQARIDFIEKDSGAKCIITMELFKEAMKEAPSEDWTAPHLDDEAFAIYTSGSTGNPKGIVHTHRNLMSIITRTNDFLKITPDDVQMACAPFSFIVNIADVYIPLYLGQTIHLMVPEKCRDARAIQQYATEHPVTTAFLSPQMLKIINLENTSMKLVLTGSERLTRTVGHGYRLINLYGCSETATITCFEVDKEYDNTPIGKPVSDLEVMVIDEKGNKVGPGGEGEVCVIGHIAHGYLNLPDQTEKAFVEQPDGRALFHTNDICRVDEDGNLIYLERADWMVKVNGQRVELQEIENTLIDVPEISNAAVKGFVNANGQTYLCGYYTINAPIDEATVREQISKRLASYMIPQYLIQIDKLPINPNGKIDRKSLKAPNETMLHRTYEAPENDKEKTICDIFAKILKLDKVGRNEDFFRIGGDSIQASMLILELDGITTDQVYSLKTPAALAEVWNGQATKAVNQADDPKFQNLFDENGRMTIYNGMRYYKRTRDENNMPRLTIYLKEDVDPALLQEAFEKTLPRYPLQRLKVVNDGVRYYLQLHDATPILHHNDGTRQVVGGEANNGYLTRIGWNDNQITMDMFHGVSDGVGAMSFLRTIIFYYCQAKYGSEAKDIPGLILADTPVDPREVADCALFLPKEPVEAPDRYQWKTAYALPDKQMDSPYACAHYTLTVDAHAMDQYIVQNDTSIAAAFSMMINRAIAQKNGLTDLPIVGAMAIDARNAYFAEKTMQCCVGTLPIYFDKSFEALSTKEQLIRTRDIILSESNAKNIIASAQKNQLFNQQLEAKYPDIAAKHNFCREVTARFTNQYTYGISYVGNFNLGKGIDEYITGMSVMLAANTMPIIVEIIKFGSEYQLTWMSHLEKDPYIAAVCDLLNAEGVPSSFKRHADFEESIALFDGEAL